MGKKTSRSKAAWEKIKRLKEEVSDLFKKLELSEERLSSSQICIDQLQEDNRFLRRQVIVDALTGIHNRKFFDDEFQREFRKARRNANPFSVVMIDIDYFKRYNDHYGHQSGDEVLQMVAQALQKVLRRPSDSASRYGGEEFVFTLPDTDEAGAQHIAEEARVTIETLRIPHVGNDASEFITLSLGVATLLPEDKKEEFLKRADNSLYKAKNCGRNRVCC